MTRDVAMGSDAPLLTLIDAGLYCPAGDFHIERWLRERGRGARAVETHFEGEAGADAEPDLEVPQPLSGS